MVRKVVFKPESARQMGLCIYYRYCIDIPVVYRREVFGEPAYWENVAISLHLNEETISTNCTEPLRVTFVITHKAIQTIQTM